MHVPSIRIIFSISDLDAEAPEADEYIQEGEDAAEGLDATSNADAAGDTTAASSAGGGGPSEDSFPVETSITITKTGTQGALTIDAVAQGENEGSSTASPRELKPPSYLRHSRWLVHDQQHLFLQRCRVGHWHVQ